MAVKPAMLGTIGVTFIDSKNLNSPTNFQHNTKLIMIEIYDTQEQLWYTAQQSDCLLIILYPPFGSASI